MKKHIAVWLVLCLVLGVTVVPGGGYAAETSIVNYAVENGDLAEGLTGWDTGDASKFTAEQHLTLKQGAALWRPIAITGGEGAPSAGDTVYARATVVLNSNVTVDDNVLIRMNAAGTLAEINDFTGVERGREVELTTGFIGGGGVIPAGQSDLWIEIHNDTPGTIELAKLEVWGERDEDGAGGAAAVIKPYATYDFAEGMGLGAQRSGQIVPDRLAVDAARSGGLAQRAVRQRERSAGGGRQSTRSNRAVRSGRREPDGRRVRAGARCERHGDQR